jgi:succinoglycan biosynthesis protein ExoO
MAAYNAADFIHESIQSVQQQTHKDWELLVVDDCSTDNTAEVVQQLSLKEPRIKLIRNLSNGGPAVARNLAISAARGDWVTVLDADDKYSPTRLEVLLKYAEHYGLDVVADNQYYYDHDLGKIINQGFFSEEEAFQLTPEMYVQNDCPPKWFGFGQLKPFIRHDFIKLHALRYPEELRFGEDFCFLFFALLRSPHKAILLSIPLYIYTLSFGKKSRVRSKRSRTVADGSGWLKHLEMVDSVIQQQAFIICPQDKKLFEALENYRKSVSRIIIWNRTRNKSRKGWQWRRPLAVLNVSMFPIVFNEIKSRLIAKHSIWVPK